MKTVISCDLQREVVTAHTTKVVIKAGQPECVVELSFPWVCLVRGHKQKRDRESAELLHSHTVSQWCL